MNEADVRRICEDAMQVSTADLPLAEIQQEQVAIDARYMSHAWAAWYEGSDGWPVVIAIAEDPAWLADWIVDKFGAAIYDDEFDIGLGDRVPAGKPMVGRIV